MNSKNQLLSTGKASKLLSVTSDTILKWIKQEKLPAVKTAGGHYRVAQEAIGTLLNGPIEKPSQQPSPSSGGLMYCWEFFAEEGKTRSECQKCLAFRAHALRCFEMNHLSKGMGFNGCSCADTCEDCSYYHYHEGRPFKVLVISDNPACRENLTREEGTKKIQFRFVSCEYDGSMVIDHFRPDFVVVDCTMQEKKCQELCSHLADDPRIPDVTLILATPPRRHAFTIPGAIRVCNPVSLNELESHLNRVRTCRVFLDERNIGEGHFNS